MLSRPLTPPELNTWKEQHHLHLKQPFTPDQVAQIVDWTNRVELWAEEPGKWMKYFEGENRQLCRVENFIEFHAGFNELICGQPTLSMVAELMGEPAVLFKEKINFKLPGGSGFGAHQDAPAFTSFGHDYHITMMIAVDDSTPSNGCLEMSDPVETYQLLASNSDGTITSELEARLPWRPLPTKAGDLLFFDSYIPHRSQPNHSQSPRRALYVTYNRRADGNVRTQYYAHKRQVFPPECERDAGVDYTVNSGPYNVGNPIR